MSEIVEQHIECTIDGGCGSSDGMCTYDDGHKHCFSCEGTEQPSKQPVAGRIKATDGQVAETVVREGSSFTPLAFRFFSNESRCLDLATLRKFDYGEGNDSRKVWCHITNVRDSSGDVVAQKLRYKDKKFTMVGDPPTPPLFWGQHLWDKGKRLVVTEGEIDAMSVFEATGSKWPVVSLPNGSASARKVFEAQSKWLDGFDEVVLCFDEDDAGAKAVKAAVKALPPGVARVTKLPLKDANELHRAGRDEDIRQAIWNAKRVRPDTILGTDALWGRFTESLPNSYVPFHGWAYRRCGVVGVTERSRSLALAVASGRLLLLRNCSVMRLTKVTKWVESFWKSRCDELFKDLSPTI